MCLWQDAGSTPDSSLRCPGCVTALAETLGDDNGQCGDRKPWKNPTLLGDWYYLGEPYSPPGYFKDE